MRRLSPFQAVLRVPGGDDDPAEAPLSPSQRIGINTRIHSLHVKSPSRLYGSSY